MKLPKVPLAIVVADLHLTLTPPPVRANESDWFGCMAKVLDTLQKTSDQLKVPILIAGDIFNRDNPPLELVNFALRHFPKCYTIPGNHDLYGHAYLARSKTGYGTLEDAKIITNIEPDKIYVNEINGVVTAFQGFPYKYPLKPYPVPKQDDVITIALVHAYCWIEGIGYPNANEDEHCKTYLTNSNGFDFLIFGDNHTPFEKVDKKSGISLINCGSTMRRRIDEINKKPSFVVLYSDKTFERKYFDISEDNFDIKVNERLAVDSSEIMGFVMYLNELDVNPFDVNGMLQSYIHTNNVSEDVREELDRLLQKVKV
jgi:DNA repair exonuclease SbcCD nuclease subunit